MDISAVIFATHRIRLLPDEGKIPWDEPAFSQRMLEKSSVAGPRLGQPPANRD
ncbi:SAM-dependent methyltransferase [Salmonella enterica subsp. enterica]|nr:SAM-dependent methyltransferase [Salmonella enterica subsp. enterica]